MVSTAEDYARFAAMLASGGELHGVRILSRKTVELMVSDHLAGMEPKPGLRFGLGLSIADDPGKSGQIVSEGTWGWDGFYSTRFWIDPAESMVGIVLTQTYPYNSGGALDRLQTAVYQTIAD
jgi:CubicO group peptidase (beta-lactamase class C family)